MSLFPSASYGNSSKPSSSKEWLENASFSSEAASTLHKKQKEDNLKERDEIWNLLETATDVNKNEEIDVDESSSSNDELLESDKIEDVKEDFGIFLDKSCDKNNLYFKKPYKVNIPKFYRGVSTCVGLPSYLEVIFKEDRKKRKRKAPERYFHFDEDLLQFHQDEDVAAVVKSEVETLNVKTRENPQNTEAWLQLVALQDKIQCKNVKLVTEKKVSILDKAIAANPRILELKLKRLKLLESISQDSDREWKNLVFKHPENRTAWNAYITHTLNHPNFTVNRTLKVFEKCFETLSAIKKQTVHSLDFIKDIESEMMIILMQLVQFLIESGHTERTIVLLLLMIEINVRTHECVDVSDVKHFYESGDPILGQPKSVGYVEWSKKFAKGGWINPVAMETEEQEEDFDVDFDKSVNENWLVLESKRGTSNVLPWRSNEECEDPGRKVDFSDVKGLLFFVKELRNQIQLFKILLQVVGIKHENENDFNFMLSQPCQLTHAYRSNDVMGAVGPLHSITCDGSCECGVFPTTPHHQFLCLVFEQLVTSCPLDVRKQICAISMGYYIIRLSELGKHENLKQELKRTSKEARKFAKSLLKNDPMNFLLWAKLGKIEFLSHKLDECRKIFFNALYMTKTQIDALQLCRSFIELLNDTDVMSVKRVLSALGDGQNFSGYLQENKDITGAVMLRAARSLERICEELGCLYQQVDVQDTGELSQFANSVYCHVIYMKITSPSSVEHTLRKYVEIIRKEKTTGNPQASVDLHQIHALHIQLIDHDYQRSNVYRNAVLYALDDFYDSPLFALKLCQIEVGSSLSSVARRLFTSMSNEVVSFYAIYFEILRLRQSSDEMKSTPRILHLLERAVKTHGSNALLWRMYAHLSNKPQEVLIRATASCPWSKSIACDRIRKGDEEINDVVIFMQEKGIRVRTPVEEVSLLLAM